MRCHTQTQFQLAEEMKANNFFIIPVNSSVCRDLKYPDFSPYCRVSVLLISSWNLIFSLKFLRLCLL